MRMKMGRSHVGITATQTHLVTDPADLLNNVKMHGIFIKNSHV